MTPKEKLNLISAGEVRVRFAPSPTGSLHVGSARVALFNYLFAKQNNGSFVLRIEDTDKERSSSEFEKDILNGLSWLGMNWDEGPKNGDYIGDFGPYRQSEKSSYKKHIEKLIKDDRAYHCFCSQEEVEAERQYLMARGEAPRYNGKCSQLRTEETEEMIKKGKKSVIRLRVPLKKVKFKDIVRKEVEFDSKIMGDIVIAKDLETPLYNLAVVIDDYEMKISHVIRGEDHISNTPKQILIAEALDLPIPEYAHLPLVLAPDKSKLSKRHGAVSVTEYKEEGYLPESIINFLALLGWNPGTDREIYSINHLIKDFSLERVQKSGAIFNVKKLDFINGFYIRQKNIDDLTQICIPYLVKSNLISKDDSGNYRAGDSQREISLDFIKKAISLNQERLKKVSEISEFTDFFFQDNLNYSKDLLIWKDSSKEEIVSCLDKVYTILSEIRDWQEKEIEGKVMQEANSTGDRGKIFWPLRVALTGKKSSAGPAEVAEALGKETSLERVKEAIQLLKE